LTTSNLPLGLSRADRRLTKPMSDATVEVGATAFGLNGDDEIDEMWRGVQDRVRRMASARGVELAFVPDLDIDGVQAYVAKAQARATEEQSSDSFARVKRIFDRTLRCIMTVGSLVASGASHVRLLPPPVGVGDPQRPVLMLSIGVWTGNYLLQCSHFCNPGLGRV